MVGDKNDRHARTNAITIMPYSVIRNGIKQVVNKLERADIVLDVHTLKQLNAILVQYPFKHTIDQQGLHLF